MTFLDKYLNVTESKVTYLTKVTPVDRILQHTILKVIPKFISPNQITRFRFIMIPFVAWALLAGANTLGLILFIIAASSDALDGARARTEQRVTAWGTIYDPIADKLLISVVAVIVISKYISIELALAMVLIEIFLVASAYFRYKGKIVPAKTMGKTKMILQCLGITLLLFYIVFKIPILLPLATYILYLSVLFAILSLFVFRSI